MTWKKEDRTQAEADLAALREAGVLTSLSQIIKAEADISAWRGGHITLGQLCNRRGWDRDVIHPEYRTNDGQPRVYLTLAQFKQATENAKQAIGGTRHGFRTKQGSIRPLPVVSVRTRGGQMKDQHLSGRAWESSQDGMVWAETLTNKPPHPEHGYACLMCGINGADRLRQDVDDRTGLVCGVCVDQYDMPNIAFINA